MILVHLIGSTFITGWPTAVSAWRVLIYRSPCPREGLPPSRKERCKDSSSRDATTGVDWRSRREM